MTNTGVSYDKRSGELVLHWKINFAENYEERYPVADIIQVSAPFQHEGGWTFTITLKFRSRAPLIALRNVTKFALYPMQSGVCHDLFFEITDAYFRHIQQTRPMLQNT